MVDKLYKKIKDNWYMAKYREPKVKDKIQLVIRVDDQYLFMVSDWLTREEIENIKLSDYKFKPYKDVFGEEVEVS